MQITEAKLFEWLGRLYSENRALTEQRDRLAEQLQQAIEHGNKMAAELEALKKKKRR